MSFIEGASNVLINKSTITVINNIEAAPLMARLRDHCMVAAQFNAKERCPPPRCAESTRTAMMQRLEAWVERGPSGMFWLYGGAGAGKSALAQSLAERSRRLAASFFFSRTSRKDGDKLIPTLVYQLLHTIPDLRRFVEDQIRDNLDVFEKVRKTQMEILFVTPLKTAFNANAIEVSEFPRVIIIDGLDECHDTDVQCDLLGIIANAISRLPNLFRVLVASRPEVHIKQTFKHDVDLQAITIDWCDLSRCDDADEDIRIFLQKGFDAIRREHQVGEFLPSWWPDEDDLSTLVERSSKHFIYASTVMEYIKSDKHGPQHRLNVVLGLDPPRDGGPFPRLDQMYSLIFRDVDASQLDKLLRAFGILHLISEEKGFFRSITKSHSSHSLIQKLLALEPGELVLLFGPLRSLVALDMDSEVLYVLQKSLFDYLLDPSRSGDFRLKLELSHETTAIYILKEHISQNNCTVENFHDLSYHCHLAQYNIDLKKYLSSPDILYGSKLKLDKLPKLCHSDDDCYHSDDFSWWVGSIFYTLRALRLQGLDLAKVYDSHIVKIRSWIPHSQPGWPFNQIHKRKNDQSQDSEKHLLEMLEIIFQNWKAPYTPRKKDKVLIRKEHAVFEAFVKIQKVLAAHSLSAMTYSGKPSEFIHSYHLFLLTRFTTCIFLSYTVDRVIAHQSIVSVPCEDGDRHEDIVVCKAKRHLKEFEALTPS